MVQAGERIKQFLADEFVKMALVAMEQDAMRQFKLAKTDEELRRAQAQSLVVDTFVYRLQSMVEEGELAKNA